MAAFVAPSRVAALKQLRCSIFQTSYNPESVRTGPQYLRRRLRGPSVAAYYPASFDIPQIIRQNKWLEMVNEQEEQRLVDVMDRKKRGKGAPKKAKTKGAYDYHWRWLCSVLAGVMLTTFSLFTEESRRLTKKR